MTTLTCPKCRQPVADAALDAGQCPGCGFPLDGPVPLHVPGGPRPRFLLWGAIGALLMVGTAVGGLLVSARQNQPATPDVTEKPLTPVPSPSPAPKSAAKVEPKTQAPTDPKPEPTDKQPEPKTTTPPAETPKKEPARAPGVMVRVDPAVEPRRVFDRPDDTAAVVDLNGQAEVTLSGTVRMLKIGSLNGKAAIDASKLSAEEIELAGDINGEAKVIVGSPNAKVTVRGYVGGNARLTIQAPGGSVTVVEGSGRLAGSVQADITAKTVALGGPVLGSARVSVTLTSDGALRVASAGERAVVSFRKAGADDPPLKVEMGTLTGGARVIPN